MNIDLRLGDCIEVMKTIKDKSIDAIITDPPYGTTTCKWDSVIDFDLMWEQLNRIIKPNGAIVLFGAEPFSSYLRISNIKNYKYDWIWNKKRGASGLHAKIKPMQLTELISVFNKHNYYPQMTKGKMRNKRSYAKGGGVYGDAKSKENDNYNDLYYPKNIIEISNAGQKGKQHPTQKPIKLMEYLIKTYTKETETILDFTMGSGSTMVACVSTNRNGIGIEMDENYFNIAKKRVEEKKEEKENKQLPLFNELN